MKFVSLRGKIDFAAAALMAFSLYGFLGNVMLDYNWGTNLITNSFAMIYSITLRQIVPFPLGYYGVGAVVYFALYLCSFLILNRGKPPGENVLETLRLASGVVILFELGLYYFVPYFMDVWVIDALRSTPLQSFTNTDLLVSAVALLAFSQITLFWLRSKSK